MRTPARIGANLNSHQALCRVDARQRHPLVGTFPFASLNNSSPVGAGVQPVIIVIPAAAITMLASSLDFRILLTLITPRTVGRPA